jgi:hypothetical protein
VLWYCTWKSWEPWHPLLLAIHWPFIIFFRSLMACPFANWDSSTSTYFLVSPSSLLFTSCFDLIGTTVGFLVCKWNDNWASKYKALEYGWWPNFNTVVKRQICSIFTFCVKLLVRCLLVIFGCMCWSWGILTLVVEIC